MRALYLTYFQWRMGGRRLFGLVRRSQDTAGAADRRESPALSPKIVRSAEHRVLSQLGSALRLPLLAAARSPDDITFRVGSAARELARDLGIDGPPPGSQLRIGTMRHRGEAKQWWIEPHAPGLPNVSVAAQGRREGLIGSTVLYVETGRGATAIEAVSPATAKRRRARVKRPGTVGPRDATGPIRRIVSGGGGPGTGKRA